MQGKLDRESKTWTNIKFTLMIDPQNKLIANWKSLSTCEPFPTKLTHKYVSIQPGHLSSGSTNTRDNVGWDFPGETELTSSRYYARLSEECLLGRPSPWNIEFQQPFQIPL